jgi:hypothetical protein
MPVKQKTIELFDTPKFIPPHVRGDRDFDGHGPIADVSARLSIHNGNELWVRVTMNARETQRDYTQAVGSADYLMHVDDNPIMRIVSDRYSAARYTDSNHDEDVITLGVAELVREFQCDGDTSGKESGIRTGVTVKFNPVTIEVME